MFLPFVMSVSTKVCVKFSVQPVFKITEMQTWLYFIPYNIFANINFSCNPVLIIMKRILCPLIIEILKQGWSGFCLCSVKSFLGVPHAVSL